MSKFRIKYLTNLLIYIFILIYCGVCYSHQTNEINGANLCNTTQCRIAGKQLRSSIDQSVDPCHDFYEFSCGGWKRSHRIPQHLSRYLRLDELDDRLDNIMMYEMNRTGGRADAMSVRYALDYYTACSDNETLELRGIRPLVDLLNRMGGWPLMGRRSQFDPNKYDLVEAFTNLYVFTGLPALFQVAVLPDANQTNTNILYFSVPEFGLGRNQLVNTSLYYDIVNAYKQYILESALLLGAYNDNQTHNDIRELFAFESKLAKLSTKPEDMRESQIWYNRMTFNSFNAMTGNRLDWKAITQRLYKKFNSNIALNPKERLVVDDMAYYREVTRLVVNTPPRVIANHLGWLTVKRMAVYTTHRFRQIEFVFNSVAKGVKTWTPLGKHCVDSLNSYLPFAYSRKYVDNYFSDISRQEVKVVVKYVKKAMRRALKDNEWLDDLTRNKSIEKLNAINEDIGYPDWLLDNKELDKLYNLTQIVDKRKAFESLLYLQTMSVYNMFQQLRKPINITLNWPTYPAKVNAYYDPTQNTITIPAGILSPPFFRNQVPPYLNFGSIGVVIGHEFTHGFDDQGSEYDSSGNLINWWNDCMKRIFKEKTKCFINKFSEYIVPEVNMTLNAKNTVGEDISDAGGIKQAFRGFKSYERKFGESQRLPYMTEYTTDQLFFISYANIACGLIRPEELKHQIEYDPHSPLKYRVNPHLSKFKPFSDAFNCKLGSQMNVGFNCELW